MERRDGKRDERGSVPYLVRKPNRQGTPSISRHHYRRWLQHLTPSTGATNPNSHQNSRPETAGLKAETAGMAARRARAESFMVAIPVAQQGKEWISTSTGGDGRT